MTRSPFRRVTRAERGDEAEVGTVHIEGHDPYNTICGHLDRNMDFVEDEGPATCGACVRVLEQVTAIARRVRGGR